jgi:hypothetical protein
LQILELPTVAYDAMETFHVKTCHGEALKGVRPAAIVMQLQESSYRHHMQNVYRFPRFGSEHPGQVCNVMLKFDIVITVSRILSRHDGSP